MADISASRWFQGRKLLNKQHMCEAWPAGLLSACQCEGWARKPGDGRHPPGPAANSGASGVDEALQLLGSSGIMLNCFGHARKVWRQLSMDWGASQPGGCRQLLHQSCFDDTSSWCMRVHLLIRIMLEWYYMSSGRCEERRGACVCTQVNCLYTSFKGSLAERPRGVQRDANTGHVWGFWMGAYGIQERVRGVRGVLVLLIYTDAGWAWAGGRRWQMLGKGAAAMTDCGWGVCGCNMRMPWLACPGPRRGRGAPIRFRKGGSTPS